MVNSNNYEAIPAITNVEQDMETGSNNTSNEEEGLINGMIKKTKMSRGIALLVGSFAVVAACMVLLSGSSSSSTSSNLAMEGMSATTSSARACTLAECFDSNCNHEVAPYTCLFHNGGPHGGCSPTEWIPFTCTEQCDLTGCDDLVIPDDAPSCAKKCSDEWCKAGSCGGAAPFTCTAGSARFGCSGDDLQWTLRVPTTTCSSCCDMSLC